MARRVRRCTALLLAPGFLVVIALVLRGTGRSRGCPVGPAGRRCLAELVTTAGHSAGAAMPVLAGVGSLGCALVVGLAFLVLGRRRVRR